MHTMPRHAMLPASQRDPVGRAFTGSLFAHAAAVSLLFLSGVLNLGREHWGDTRASSGSVGVGITKTLPIPRPEGPTNPLANDTQSTVPQAPAPVKQQPQVKAQPEIAVPIPSRIEKKKVSPQEQSRTTFRAPVQYKSNQVYSRSAPAMNSPMYGMQGAGGIDVGPASVLGNRFGGYVSLMRERIAQHWNTADLRATPSQRVAITFTIARNGSVSNVQVSQPSGNYLLDTSARRAVLDANPLPALPPQYDRSEATVELWFQLNQ